MTETDTAAPVANPYQAALEAAAARARPVAQECASALDGVLAAMRGNAWQSTTADQFFAALTANDTQARSAGQDCVDALEAAAGRQPATVPAGAWQTHWRNL